MDPLFRDILSNCSILENTEQASFKEHLLTSLLSFYGMLVTIINEKDDDISVEDTIRNIQQEKLIMQKMVASPNTSAASGQALLSSNSFRGRVSYREAYRRGNRGYRGRYRESYRRRLPRQPIHPIYLSKFPAQQHRQWKSPGIKPHHSMLWLRRTWTPNEHLPPSTQNG